MSAKLPPPPPPPPNSPSPPPPTTIPPKITGGKAFLTSRNNPDKRTREDFKKAQLRRLAIKSGVEVFTETLYDTMRHDADAIVKQLVEESVILMEHDKCKTLQLSHLKHVMQNHKAPLYGFCDSDSKRDISVETSKDPANSELKLIGDSYERQPYRDMSLRNPHQEVTFRGSGFETAFEIEQNIVVEPAVGEDKEPKKKTSKTHKNSNAEENDADWNESSEDDSDDSDESDSDSEAEPAEQQQKRDSDDSDSDSDSEPEQRQKNAADVFDYPASDADDEAPALKRAKLAIESAPASPPCSSDA
jgi:histone H3/H4